MALPNQQTVDYPNFKLVIVGDGGTGKTTFVKRHLTSKFEKKYEPTIDVEEFIYWISSQTVGKLDFIVGTHPVRRNSVALGMDTLVQAQWNVAESFLPISGSVKNIPIVRCGNKVDVKNRQVKAKQVTFHRKKNLQYYEISAKSNYNFEKPFLYLAIIFAGDTNLHFVEFPALAPPEVQIELDVQQQ